jgi:hypothetical protein
MRERAPGVWELIVESGRDQITGRHSGADISMDDLFAHWLVEPERKGRAPSTIHGYRTTYQSNIKSALG